MGLQVREELVLDFKNSLYKSPWFYIGVVCSVYFIFSGSYYLFTEKGVPVTRGFRDFMFIYELFQPKYQGIVNIGIGLMSLVSLIILIIRSKK